eukprot:1159705-Pelagomonas_calceolata.AAC.4
MHKDTHTHARHWQGSLLANNYGTKPSEELLLGYGFLLPDNEADYFHCSIAHSGTTKPTQQQQQQQGQSKGQADHTAMLQASMAQAGLPVVALDADDDPDSDAAEHQLELATVTEVEPLQVSASQ